MSSICDVPGIAVGHEQNENARTGCTVILPEKEAIAGVDARGSAPGSREIEVLHPVRMIQKIHAIVLTGGSAFGLDAACGVMAFLEEHNIGYDTGVAKVPIVPAAVIYDLAVGDSKIRPDRVMGYKACENASLIRVDEGLVGAGTGATVGKLAGMENAMLGGVGTCSQCLEDTIVIGALCVVNSLGNIIDPKTGAIVVGTRTLEGKKFLDMSDYIKLRGIKPVSRNTNTTLAVIATNALLNRETAIKVAQMAHDGMARVVKPAHTMFDGDIVFVLSVGNFEADISILGTIASDLVAESILRAVRISNKL
jgi:L-aminopeptidase/D-esterase-like protein